MKNPIKEELQNFPLLIELRDQMLQSKMESGRSLLFQSIYRDFIARRRKRKMKLLLFTTAVSSAAAVLIVSLFQSIADQHKMEQQYYNRQSEWIAISDEAILTSEYIKMYENQPETNEIEWIWHTLD